MDVGGNGDGDGLVAQHESKSKQMKNDKCINKKDDLEGKIMMYSQKEVGKLIETNPDTLILMEHLLKKDNRRYLKLDDRHIFVHGDDVEDIKRKVRSHFDRNIYRDDIGER